MSKKAVREQARKLVEDARHGCGPLAYLSYEDIVSLAATFAPYGREARDKYLAEIRETADRRHPCQYE